jgi:hypothetical protein
MRRRDQLAQHIAVVGKLSGLLACQAVHHEVVSAHRLHAHTALCDEHANLFATRVSPQRIFFVARGLEDPLDRMQAQPGGLRELGCIARPGKFLQFACGTRGEPALHHADAQAFSAVGARLKLGAARRLGLDHCDLNPRAAASS